MLESINRFCRVVAEINEINDNLDPMKSHLYQHELSRLENLHREFQDLLKKIPHEKIGHKYTVAQARFQKPTRYWNSGMWMTERKYADRMTLDSANSLKEKLESDGLENIIVIEINN